MPSSAAPFLFDPTGIVLQTGTGLADQLYREIRARILSGQLDSNVKLPTTREFARVLQVSRTTIIRAYERLYAEGYIESRVGDGTYVSAPVAELPAAGIAPVAVGTEALSTLAKRVAAEVNPTLLEGPPRAFRLGVPAIDLFPGAVWARLQADFWRRSPEVRAGYGDSAGDAHLREMVAGYLRNSRGLSCDPSQIVITGGTQQAVFLCSQLLLEPGSLVAIENPGYARAANGFAMAGARLVGINVDAEGLDTAHLARETDARMVYVTPSHQYPVGATLSLARRLELLAWAQAVKGFVLEDDYDGEYRYSGTPLALLASLDRAGRVIYIGTFSKIAFPGLRLAYIVAPPALAKPLAILRSRFDRHSSVADQAVMAEFIAQGHFHRHVRRVRRASRARRDALTDEWDRLRPAGITLPDITAGLHVTVRVPSQAVERALVSSAASAGVEVDPLTRFWLPGSRPASERGGVVIGFGGVNEQRIIAGVRTLHAAWSR